MSKKDRTIAFYSIYLIDKATDDAYEDVKAKNVIKKILKYLNSITDKNEKKIEKKADNKIFYLESIENPDGEENIIYLTFVSAKYNHVPALIDTTNLTEKTSNKTDKDGEKEYTHVALFFKGDEVVMVHEQRMNGTPKSVVEEYLKNYFRKYLTSENMKVDYELVIEIIPDKNFVEELKDIKRINLATIVVSKNIVKSKAFERFSGRDIVQDNVQLVFKPIPKGTISKDDVLEAYNNKENEEIKRIIVHGFNENGRVKLDTEPIKTIEKISVELDENGIVTKESIQGEFKKIFEGMM